MNNSPLHSVLYQTIEYKPDLLPSIFASIADQPWAMLLRSASETHPDSRYDILVAQPISTLVTRGSHTEIYHNNKRTTSTLDPLTLVQTQLDQLLSKQSSPIDLPFCGGALGYFAYDLGRRIEQIPEIAEHDIKAPEMAVGIYDWALVADHHTQSAYIVGNNLKNRLSWLEKQEVKSVEKKHSSFKLTSDWQSNMTPHEYKQKFDQVQEYLLAGDCYQINLAQRFKASYRGDTWQAYQALEQANLAPFSAYLQLEDCCILSVSPERFLHCEQREVQTKPIKGTRPRSEDPGRDRALAQELAKAEKDRAENLMIVDLLRNDIGRVAKPGSVSVPQLFEVESFPAVHHLVSTITAQLANDYSVTDCLHSCFPGGSITGAPKVRAMEIIEELEPHRRSVYCGSIGYLSRCGKMDTSITIRTLMAENKTIYAWAGGGLVADSNADSEYQETLDKLSRILPTLNKECDKEE